MAVAAIEAEGLRKRYGSVEALRGVDLTVETGTVFVRVEPRDHRRVRGARDLALPPRCRALSLEVRAG
jgi:ABC-type polar amino acid transport system ATPase subunit